MGKCKFCQRNDLYLDYDERYPNQYLDGQQYFAPDEDVPHFMACPDNPYNKKKEQEFREGQDRKHKYPPKSGRPKPVIDTGERFRDDTSGPIARIEKEITEIKAILKINTALLEWIQQALISSNVKSQDKGQEYRD